MAIAKGKVVTELTTSNFKKYIGTAPVNVIAVNPTKAELEKIYGTELSKDVSYLSSFELDGKSIEVATVDIVVKTTDSVKNENGEPLNLIQHIRIPLHNRPRVSSKGTVQVMDPYGRTAWPTPEQVKNHEIPEYINPFGLDKNYRQTFVHEDWLTNFIQKFLGIPSVLKWSNNQVSGYIDEPADAESRLEVSDIQSAFKGDFSKIKEYINYQPDNAIIVFFGVRTGDDGRQYQTIYPGNFVKASGRDAEYERVYKDITTAQAGGSMPNTEFLNEPLKVYEVNPSNLETPEAAEDPFAAPMGDMWQ